MLLCAYANVGLESALLVGFVVDVAFIAAAPASTSLPSYLTPSPGLQSYRLRTIFLIPIIATKRTHPLSLSFVLYLVSLRIFAPSVFVHSCSCSCVFRSYSCFPALVPRLMCMCSRSHFLITPYSFSNRILFSSILVRITLLHSLTPRAARLSVHVSLRKTKSMDNRTFCVPGRGNSTSGKGRASVVTPIEPNLSNDAVPCTNPPHGQPEINATSNCLSPFPQGWVRNLCKFFFRNKFRAFAHLLFQKFRPPAG
ncbi:hypothetical protein K439DRAFT_1107293 [Ramaria rubella]|nr:hypothetical protein K439DRAFT_1107293 [Ramaria rubella]